MSQITLTYGPNYEGKQAWQMQLDVLRSAVAHLVAKEVADQLDISRSTLSDALKSETDRRWAAEWTHTVKAMLAARRGDDVALDLLRRLCDADVLTTTLIVSDPIEMTDDEEAAVSRLLEKLRRRKARSR
jgi:hypothetical protein